MKHYKIDCQRNQAFTVLELAVVVLIVSLTVMTITPAMLSLAETAKSEATGEKIKNMQTDIDDFFKDNGRYPDSLVEVYGEVPLDEWGNPYQYLNHDKAVGQGQLRKDKNLVPINSDYDLYSMGPDGETSSPLTAEISQDDIVRGRNGLYIGVAADY